MLKFDELLPAIDETQNTRDFDDSKKYDSVWNFITRGKRTFKAERFFYCRVYNGNDRSIEVVMIWIYLEARLKHETTILGRIGTVFGTISDQATEIVGRAVVNILDPTLQRVVTHIEQGIVAVAAETRATVNNTSDNFFQGLRGLGKDFNRWIRTLVTETYNSLISPFVKALMVVMIILAIYYLTRASDVVYMTGDLIQRVMSKL